MSTAGAPVHPLPASCLVSHPFVPHQGLSRERPLSCTEVLTAAPALLCSASLGGHLLSWGGRKLVTLARSCHIPCAFLWWLVDTGWWHRGWAWCSSTGRGCAPGHAEGLQGWGWNISGVQGSLSCLGGSVGQLEVPWCSWMFSFTMAPAGSLGKVVWGALPLLLRRGEHL